MQTPSNIPKHLSYSQAYDISMSGTEKEKEKMKMKKPLTVFFFVTYPILYKAKQTFN